MTACIHWRMTLICCLVLSALAVTPAFCEEVIDLTPSEQAHLAEQFAPVLIFHSAEKYFPANPLFQLGSEPETRQAAELLGTPESRAAIYDALPIEEKAKVATVYYRAYTARRSGKTVVVLEYWFSYIWDDYRVRGNIIPVWMNGSHPNDLEHVHLVLHRENGKYVTDEIYASAHEGKTPANRYRFGDAPRDGSTRLLVELGSHALAPDIDGDGVFTPGEDGDSGSKIFWGIRDRGYTWPRYKQSYMTPRQGDDAIVFAYKTDEGQFQYRLVSVDALAASFSKLALTPDERKHAFESDVFWFRRVFGSDNGRPEKLLVPEAAKVDTDSIGIKGVSSSERKLFVGTVLNVDEQGIFAAGRYSFLTPSKVVPDFLFEADGIATANKGYFSPQAYVSYPLDAFTRVMFGRAMVTDSFTFERRQWDWVGMIEVRLGNMRVSAATRSVGPVRSAAKEFRLFYSF